MASHLKKIDYDLIDSFVHEIKTPLTTIKLFSELVISASTSDKVTQSAQKIDKKTDELTRIINYFRDLAKLADEKLIFANTKIPIDQLLDDTLTRLQTQHPSLVITQTGKTPQSIIIDSDKFYQIIEIIVDRLFYYHPDLPTIYLHVSPASKIVFFYLSIMPFSQLTPPVPFDTDVASLINPSTGLVFAQRLIAHYKGHFQFFKNDQNIGQLYFSIPANP